MPLKESEPITKLGQAELRKAIEDFYLPRHLVRAIYDIGHIPAHSQESHVGVGFIDIADYTYLSKFLSPKENQILLNGLYTAFHIVLERHGGYLNKIEGDSMMFHFDSIIDKKLWNKPSEEVISYIAKQLFYTCVEMQRYCVMFNNADEDFLLKSGSAAHREALQNAYDIINTLRNKHELSSALDAFFQIRIRIGANIGEVTIGNFGPDGSKHWDIIGMPVINAKRMESTAPVGGLRISQDFYRILEKAGVVRDYYERFRREAAAKSSSYRDIALDELFAFKEVTIREKKNASYPTYSVQVNYKLPEDMAYQVERLLEQGPMGASRILDFIQYYRGNRYVVDALERLFKAQGVRIRKAELMELIHPKRFKELKAEAKNDRKALERNIEERFSLFQVLQYLDTYLDIVQQDHVGGDFEEFVSYEDSMKVQRAQILKDYEQKKFIMVQRTYFFEVVFPLAILSLKNSMLEYQKQQQDAYEVTDLETLAEINSLQVPD